MMYLIAGANGAGKTTFARAFSRLNKIAFLNVDDIALSLDKNVDKVKFKAGKTFLPQLKNVINSNKSFMV